MKNKPYFLLILLIPFVLGSQTTPAKVEEKKEVLTTLLTNTKQKQDEIKDKLESIEVVLPQKKSKSPQVKTEIRRYVRTVYSVIRDTIYMPCDTLTVYVAPSPKYGGDSVQKAQWKQDKNEGNFFINLFKRKKW